MSRSALKKRLIPVLASLVTGALVLPGLIYGCGVAVLGPYEGSSLGKTYQVVLGGLVHGSVASWIVVLGPFLLWQLGRLIAAWWPKTAKG